MFQVLSRLDRPRMIALRRLEGHTLPDFERSRSAAADPAAFDELVRTWEWWNAADAARPGSLPWGRD